jgi:hypothetical protein
MSFEPRLLRQDEPDDEAELPADLVELAAQLSADAKHLAQCFPAATSQSPAPIVDPARRLLRGAAAAVFLCGVGMLAGRLWHHAARPSRPAEGLSAAKTTVGKGEVSAPATGVQFNPLAVDRLAVPGAAGLLFGSLSGGEQEGVLDLLEEQPADEAQVSI